MIKTQDYFESVTEPNGRLKLIVVLLFFVGTLIINHLSAIQVFPPPAGDAPYWLVAVINHMNGLGFVNHIADGLTTYTDRYGAYSLAGYPMLYPYVLSTISFGDDIQAVYVSLALMKNIGLTLTLLSLLVLLAKGKKSLDWMTVALLITILMTFNVIAGGGRPEALVVLILSFVGFLIVFKGTLHPIAMGLFIGLIGSTNPMTGLLCGVALLMLYGYWYPFGQAVKNLLITGFSALLIFFLVLEVQEGVLVSLQRLSGATDENFGNWFSVEQFIWHNFFIKERFLVGLAIIYSITIIGMLPLLQQPRSVVVYYTGFIFFLIAYFIASVARPEPVYNIQALLPSGLLLAAWLFVSGRFKAMTLSIYIASSAGFLVSLVGFGAYLADGTDFDTGKESFGSILNSVPNHDRIGIDDGLWALASDHSDFARLYQWNSRVRDYSEDNTRNLVVTRQMYSNTFPSGSLSPASKISDPKRGIDHLLVCDYFNHKEPKLAGIRYGRSVPGYGFAVYAPRELYESGFRIPCER